jgi:hypothetical protein
MKIQTLVIAITALLVSTAAGQMRPVEPAPAAVKPAPQSIEAKYEGGIFGFSKKQEGTLRFDDINERLVFFAKDGKEQFSLPYLAMQVIYPQSRSVTSTTGNVVRHIPLPGSFLGGFIKEKRRYLIIHFEDPDVRASGVASFKLDSKDLLDSVLQSLAGKAELTQRGEAFYRPKNEAKDGI